MSHLAPKSSSSRTANCPHAVSSFVVLFITIHKLSPPICQFLSCSIQLTPPHHHHHQQPPVPAYALLLTSTTSQPDIHAVHLPRGGLQVERWGFNGAAVPWLQGSPYSPELEASSKAAVKQSLDPHAALLLREVDAEALLLFIKN